MDKKTFAGVALCILFYLSYTQYLQKKYPNYNAGNRSASHAPSDTSNAPAAGTTGGDAALAPATPAVAGSNAAATPSEQPAPLSAADLVIETDTTRYQFSQETGGFDSVQLKSYRNKIEDTANVELTPNRLQILGTTAQWKGDAHNPLFAARNGRSLSFWRTEGTWKITQTYTVPENGYRFDLKFVYENIGTAGAELTAGMAMKESMPLAHSGGFFGSGSRGNEPTLLLGNGDGDTKRFPVKKFCKNGEGDEDGKGTAANLAFVGFDQHYFLNVLTPDFPQVSYQMNPLPPFSEQACTILVQAFQPYGAVKAGEKVELNFHSFFGPKQSELLASYDQKLGNTIDLGKFAVLAKPLLSGLRWTDGFTHNFGFAIILVTLALKLCFYPLTRQAAISMQKMKKLQPEMNAIRERHKDDPPTQQRELMAFMVKNKVNPMKGCLPILPQIPVFFAYYQVLQHAIELRHAPFAGWIHDLSAMDPFYVTPVLLGVGMFLQQKLTPTTGMDKTQEKILMFMPIMFSVMMLTLPAGMVIYMLTNTVVSILQQQWLNRRLA